MSNFKWPQAIIDLAECEEHDDETCPQDDTCECENIRVLNDAFREVDAELLRRDAEAVAVVGRARTAAFREGYVAALRWVAGESKQWSNLDVVSVYLKEVAGAIEGGEPIKESK